MPHSPDSSAASDLLTVSTRASSVNAFPKTVGTVLTLPERDREQDSPAVTGFTFSDLGPGEQPSVPPVAGISFDLDPFDSKPHAVTPSSSGSSTTVKMAQSMARTDSNRRRTQYFEDVLSYKDGHGQSAKERVQRDSPVIAELRTNVIIKDEFTVVTNLSQHLSERYRRPESAIMITVTHSSCLMMAGSFAPAYILTITAIPSEVQPVTNKRNAYLIQHFVADTLHVPSSRGVIKFQELPEERLATNGSTVAGDIERLEKQQTEDKSGLGRSMTSKSSRKSLIGDKRKSLLSSGKKNDELERQGSTRSIRSLRPSKSVKSGKSSPPVPQAGSKPPLTNGLANGNANGNHTSVTTGQTHRLSPVNGVSEFGLYFDNAKSNGRPQTAPRPASSRKHLNSLTGNIYELPAPPPVPMETADPPKMSKRKSIIAIFKRSEPTIRA